MQLTDGAKGRSYLFDNYKALLIFLVVTGHMIDPAYGNTSAIDFVKWYIFAFHMPAFLFITGFFSKRKKAMGTLIQKFLVPYVIFQTLYYLEYTYVIGTSPDLALWIPKFSLWYLLSVFIYKAITPYVMKIPYPVAMVITVALGLVIGFWPFADNLLSIPRIVYFYPFYLTGVYLNMDTVHKLRRKGGRIVSAIFVIAFTIFLAFDKWHLTMDDRVLQGRYGYDFLHQAPLEGMVIRLGCYAVGMALTFAVMLLIYDKECKISFLGTKTLSIYLFHGLVYKWIGCNTNILQSIDTNWELLLLLISCAALTLLLSTWPFDKFTTAISSISLTKIKNKFKHTTDFSK